MLLDPSTYIDHNKIPHLVDLIEEFSKQDVSKFWVDVGEMNVGTSINWKCLVMFDQDGTWTIDKELEEKSKHILEYLNTMKGLRRATVNFLEKGSFMPLHVDNEDLPEYDTSSPYYNIIVPVTNNGQSIIDDRVIKNQKGYSLIFDGQVPHGAINSTQERRITIYLMVNKTEFNHDNT